MTVILNLAPETEQRLRRKAARQGQDVASYLQHLAEREVQDEKPVLTDEEFESLLDDLAAGSENRPVLDSVAFERSSFYGNRG